MTAGAPLVSVPGAPRGFTVWRAKDDRCLFWICDRPLTARLELISIAVMARAAQVSRDQSDL